MSAPGWRPSTEDLYRYGRRIPDEVYGTPDFERKVALLKRTETIAKHLTGFLKKTDRLAKTIVFCVDQEHASEMRTALNNLNADLVQQYPDYVCRVTADEGDIGRGHMQRFQDVETRTPVILTTSQLLTTGLDAPTCRNIVLVRLVNSMVEFKQIIGRGTRVRDDYGKLWFNILDYTGTATRNFADPVNVLPYALGVRLGTVWNHPPAARATGSEDSCKGQANCRDSCQRQKPLGRPK